MSEFETLHVGAITEAIELERDIIGVTVQALELASSNVSRFRILTVIMANMLAYKINDDVFPAAVEAVTANLEQTARHIKSLKDTGGRRH